MQGQQQQQQQSAAKLQAQMNVNIPDEYIRIPALSGMGIQKICTQDIISPSAHGKIGETAAQYSRTPLLCIVLHSSLALYIWGFQAPHISHHISAWFEKSKSEDSIQFEILRRRSLVCAHVFLKYSKMRH